MATQQGNEQTPFSVEQEIMVGMSVVSHDHIFFSAYSAIRDPYVLAHKLDSKVKPKVAAPTLSHCVAIGGSTAHLQTTAEQGTLVAMHWIWLKHGLAKEPQEWSLFHLS